MVNKEHWIYTDGNAGEAILAPCEGATCFVLTVSLETVSTMSARVSP